MKITRLSLTNFRSFKETQTLEFAPTTLLFGPNSTGKTTVLMAFFYIQHILEKGNCDPQYISALGDKHIGGFTNLVHKRDKAQPITIKIEFEKESIGSSYFDPSEVLSYINEVESIYAHMPEVMVETNTIALEFTIEWSTVMGKAYLSAYNVWLNNEFIAKVVCDSGLQRTMITELNFSHELLTIDEPDTDFPDTGEELLSLPVAIDSFSGALPKLGGSLKLNVDAAQFIDKILLDNLISEILISPLDNLYKLLSESVCIGPLRSIPNSKFEPAAEPVQSDWYNGKAAWDNFYSAANAFKRNYNEWLDEKFDLGYQLVVKVEESSSRFILPFPPKLIKDSEFTPELARRILTVQDVLGSSTMSFEYVPRDETEPTKSYNTDIDLTQILPAQFTATPEEIKALSLPEELYKPGDSDKRSTIFLWDKKNNISVTANDIGVGVSQLFPLIIAGLTQERGFVSCEQPELHVHPRIQVEIGDFLTQANRDVNFIIETHSEHLILRILRRIRETTDNELPEGILPVTADDVSIMYIEPSDNGSTVKRIHVDGDGEFINSWPKGFFGERRRELF
ncbi:DUF3696 domain-containing protein [Paraferrimonas haliotis]|uniref:DUF3696 domain-containing protein n=1 Tax=Paraferrimonas haliotis TaxID=2013866 RepID=UPI000BA92C04|nr:DUF3696 domain-containing protein [Paraferrimonas haliotis]